MVFRCPRCLYETKYKGDLKKHVNKKSVCFASNENISKETILEELKKKSSRYEVVEIDVTTKSNKCGYCNMVLSRPDSLKRHVLKCKSKDLEIHTLRETIEELRKRPTVNNIIINNNNHNSNNISVEIKINAYGKERVDHITNEYIHELVRYGVYGAIPNLISNIHFNDMFPENRNIRITNEKSKYAQIFNGDNFIRYPKDYLLKELIHKSVDIIDDAYYENENKKPISYKRFEKDFYINKQKELLKDLSKRTECMILNSKV